METPVEQLHAPTPTSRAWYGASISEFLNTSPDSVVGRLATKNEFTLLGTQKDAWLEQITLLHQCLSGLTIVVRDESKGTDPKERNSGSIG